MQWPSCSANQEICLILCNPKVHYRVNKNPPTVPILAQFNPVTGQIKDGMSGKCDMYKEMHTEFW